MEGEGNNLKKILIAEDEKPLARALTLKLEHAGFFVKSVGDGTSVIDELKKDKFDILLLDLVMPKMDGMEMLKELRKDDWGKNAKVVVLTNLSDTQTLSQIMENEVFEYFVKTDIKLEEFVQKIKIKLGVV